MIVAETFVECPGIASHSTLQWGRDLIVAETYHRIRAERQSGIRFNGAAT